MISIEHTFVISLAIDAERRTHINAHFSEIGLTNFSFANATPYYHSDVSQFYSKGLVASYPPCFRCGQKRCECPNNVLIPQQVANWLSFRDVWRRIPNDPDAFYMICEDDVAFHVNAIPLLREFLAGFEPEKEQVLIRLAQSGEEPYRDLDVQALHTDDRRAMSNAAYILNGALAARLSNEDPFISHTSDVWLHDQIADDPDVQAVTVSPLLATDLSYNVEFAEFVSRIHPKGINPSDEMRKKHHIKRMVCEETYRTFHKVWSDDFT